MRAAIAVLASLLGAASPAVAFSPHQVFMLLAAFQTYQSECATDAPAFSSWDAASFDRISTRFGVDIRDTENAQRLSRYISRMRAAIDPEGKKLWCETVRSQLEAILKGFGQS